MLSVISIGPNVGTSINNLGVFTSNVASMALIIAGILTFAYLVYGGVLWVLSGGDPAKVEEARNRITHAIIGLTIVASSWAIYALINNFFGISQSEINTGPTYNQVIQDDSQDYQDNPNYNSQYNFYIRDSCTPAYLGTTGECVGGKLEWDYRTEACDVIQRTHTDPGYACVEN